MLYRWHVSVVSIPAVQRLSGKPGLLGGIASVQVMISSHGLLRLVLHHFSWTNSTIFYKNQIFLSSYFGAELTLSVPPLYQIWNKHFHLKNHHHSRCKQAVARVPTGSPAGGIEQDLRVFRAVPVARLLCGRQEKMAGLSGLYLTMWGPLDS